MFRYLKTGAAVALLVFLLLYIPACQSDRNETAVSTSGRHSGVKPPVETPSAELVATQDAFIDVYAAVMPTVVNISATRMRSPDSIGPLFEHFFGDMFKSRPQPKQEAKSLGSGFVISAEGFILTNEHVVKEAEKIKVRLADGRSLPAEIIGVDPRTDVAVIKVKTGKPLPVAVLGDSANLRVGQWALAIGNPFGLEGTLTVGIISATERANLGIEDYEDFIQTDASINPGNSGGPLLNIHGEVIGINTAIVASGQGIGFAIPINLARLISEQLIEDGEVTRGWLGVSIQPLTDELAASFGLERATGALVNRVLPDSPAAAAGIRRGDVLLRVNGKEVRGVRELQLMVASTRVGQQVEVVVRRDDENIVLKVKVSERSEASVAAMHHPEDRQAGAIGLDVGPAESGEGVAVLAVDSESPAATAGVRAGDVILTINRVVVNDADAFVREAKKVKSGDNIVLLLRRDDKTMYLAFNSL
ncbi:MAG: peptidase [Desulfuromonas sp.]|nr:MAG: peptidase [Desulfuromonas sp.]